MSWSYVNPAESRVCIKISGIKESSHALKNAIFDKLIIIIMIIIIIIIYTVKRV